MKTVRNSKMLGIFAEIVNGPHGSLRSVEIAGRGIAAEVRTTLWVMDVGKASEQGGLANKLLALSEIEDLLIATWDRFLSSQLTDSQFEAELEEVVDKLDAWCS